MSCAVCKVHWSSGRAGSPFASAMLSRAEEDPQSRQFLRAAGQRSTQKRRIDPAPLWKSSATIEVDGRAELARVVGKVIVVDAEEQPARRRGAVDGAIRADQNRRRIADAGDEGAGGRIPDRGVRGTPAAARTGR